LFLVLTTEALDKLAVPWDDAELQLPGECFLAQLVPALVELALVFVRPFLGHMMRRVRCAGREVSEERLVGHQRFLLADPIDRLGGHVVGEVVALLSGFLWFDRRSAVVQCRIILVRLAAEEPREILEPTAAGGARLERPHRAGL
jgi:hypothetical protein